MSDHSLLLVNCSKMELTGINNVNTFDEEEIILETARGFLFITGQELHVTMLNLEEGKVVLEGKVTSMEYKDQGSDVKTKSKNILNRLLK